jgi:transposase
LIDRCAGIDVGQALLVVCVRVVTGSKLVEEVRSFGATTPDLLQLRDWLATSEVTHVAMESTGVYWKAPYYLLEDEFEVLLVKRQPPQTRPRPQDRRDRRPVDRGGPVLRFAATQFRPAAAVSRAA